METTETARRVYLRNGKAVPQLGFGLYKITKDRSGVEILKAAIRTGYRHFDGASLYGNSSQLGQAIQESNIPRSDLFLTTKIWNTELGEVREVVTRELKSLQTNYLDVVYIHWPVPSLFVNAYKKLEELCREGIIRGIGLSNFNESEYQLLMDAGITIPPVVNQFEVSPAMYRPNVVRFFQSRNIVVVASKALNRAASFDNEIVLALARKHKVSPSQIYLRWSIQKALVPVCKTSSPCRMKANASIWDFSLDTEDMEALDVMTSAEDICQRKELEAQRKTSS